MLRLLRLLTLQESRLHRIVICGALGGLLLSAATEWRQINTWGELSNVANVREGSFDHMIPFIGNVR